MLKLDRSLATFPHRMDRRDQRANTVMLPVHHLKELGHSLCGVNSGNVH